MTAKPAVEDIGMSSTAGLAGVVSAGAGVASSGGAAAVSAIISTGAWTTPNELLFSGKCYKYQGGLSSSLLFN